MKKKSKKKKRKKSPLRPGGGTNNHHRNGASQEAYGDHAILYTVLTLFSFLFSCQNEGICF